MKILTKDEIKLISKKNKISEREALLLLADILDRDSTKLFFEKSFNIADFQFETFLEYVKRISKFEPISKVISKKEFYGIKFKTNKHTLDPRPETELIVDLFQFYFKDSNQNLSILDLGSGTGCIGLSILSLYKNAQAEFVDISKDALDVSIENAKNLNLDDRCKFTLSNWFEKIIYKYDAIVTNPPYISKDFDLPKEVLYDPKRALFSGKKGMDAYNEIIPKAYSYIKDSGKLFIEIGFDQKDKILKLNENLEILQVSKDYSGFDRVIVFEKTEKLSQVNKYSNLS